MTAQAAATVSGWGFVISPEQLLQTAQDIGEPSVLNRAGGAPTLAVRIAHVFHQIVPGADMGFWYHFGIRFEALFILTALDAGTRSGHFMLQDLLGNFVPSNYCLHKLKRAGLFYAAGLEIIISHAALLMTAATSIEITPQRGNVAGIAGGVEPPGREEVMTPHNRLMALFTLEGRRAAFVRSCY